MDSDEERKLKLKIKSVDRRKIRALELEEDEMEHKKEMNARMPPEPQDIIVPEDDENIPNNNAANSNIEAKPGQNTSLS